MSVKTLTQLAAQAQQIKNETSRGANTASRVGTLAVDTTDTIFALRKPEVYFAKNKLICDLGNHATEYGDVFLQVVHYNKRRKCWQAASGAGVKDINPVAFINHEQAILTNVNLLRCKILLASNVTEYDFDNGGINIYMFGNLFEPYYKLRQFSFFNIGTDTGTDLLNVQRNTGYTKTSYHQYGLKKTGLAVTKIVTNASGSKSQILSNILPFTIRVNAAKTIATVNFGNKRKFNAGLS